MYYEATKLQGLWIALGQRECT